MSKLKLSIDEYKINIFCLAPLSEKKNYLYTAVYSENLKIADDNFQTFFEHTLCSIAHTNIVCHRMSSENKKSYGLVGYHIGIEKEKTE